jgi:carbon storage regulator CsrA
MLVLTRKYQEKIRIGDNITITVLRTKGKAVRLGIEAPADVPVIRGELAFEPAAAGAATQHSRTSLEQKGAALDSPSRSPARRTETPSSWTAQSPVSPAANQVKLQRLPREKVAGILPQLVPGSGPLRGMMERR